MIVTMIALRKLTSDSAVTVPRPRDQRCDIEVLLSALFFSPVLRRTAEIIRVMIQLKIYVSRSEGNRDIPCFAFETRSKK